MSEPKKLKVGLEVHRLLSNQKLFCGCKYKKYPFNHFITFETEYPVHSKINSYSHDYVNYCDYEKEQLPPILNKKVFHKALKIVKTIPEIKIPKKILFNRKHIVDGSIPKGYQISAVVGYDGTISLINGKKIRVTRVYLEEDSCTYVVINSKKIYSTERCGLPLLEIVTEPVVLSAQETKELMVTIQKHMAQNFNLYRGGFSIRQDVNVSSGERVTEKIEFKGMDKLSLIETIYEVSSEHFLETYAGKTLKVNEDGSYVVLRTSLGTARMHPETDLPVYDSLNKKALNYWDRNDLLKPLYDDLKGTIKNKKNLKSLHFWIKKYDLSKKDLYYFISLYPVWGQKLYSIYKLYLQDLCSYEGLKLGRVIKPYERSWLESQSKKLSKKQFYMHYKLYLPRSFTDSNS